MLFKQRILLHLTSLYIFGNGAWMVLKWYQDSNAYKDSFGLVVGIASLILGFVAFVMSMAKPPKN